MRHTPQEIKDLQLQVMRLAIAKLEDVVNCMNAPPHVRRNIATTLGYLDHLVHMEESR